MIFILYFLNFFTMLFINFIKNGSGHYLFIIFCQNRDLDLTCWSILYRVVLCRRSWPVDQLAELATMLSKKYQKHMKGDDILKLDTNGKIFSRPTLYNKLCISNSLSKANMRPQRWTRTRYDQTQFSTAMERLKEILTAFFTDGDGERKKESGKEGRKEGR